MKKKLLAFYENHRELVLYFTFGIITTIASLGACYITLKLGVLVWHDEQGEPTEFLDILGSTVQWVVGVLTAFFTNKKWVFTYAEQGIRASSKQLLKFSSSRVGTYFLEVFINLGVIALFDLCSYRAPVLPVFGLFSLELSSRLWAKVVSSVVVVIANYFISKLFVFKKKKK